MGRFICKEPTSTPCPLPYTVPSEPYHDEAAVKVEALATALGHHDADAEGPVRASCQREEQHVEAHVGGQAEELAAVVVPVGGGQWARPVPAPRSTGRLQPVGSAAREGVHSRGMRWGVLGSEGIWMGSDGTTGI